MLENKIKVEFDAKLFGFAVAISFAIIWLVFSLLVFAMPSMMFDINSHMMHSDSIEMRMHFSFAGVLSGLIGWSILAGITGWLVGSIYRKLLD